MKQLFVLALSAALLLGAAACSAPAEAPAPTETPAPTEAPAPTETSAPTETPAPTKAPAGTYADIVIKDYGTVTVLLDSSAAPATVANFVALAEDGFYDGLTFHRIINGFMMQGGAGQGAAAIEGEFAANGHDNPISHVRGVISMARASDPNSASSQFFIVQSDSTYLDGQYAGFGHVTAGMDVVDEICADARPTDNNGSIAPDAQPVIESVTIREVP